MIPRYTTYVCTLCPYRTTKQTGCPPPLPIIKCPICGRLMKAKKTSLHRNTISQVADIIESVVKILIKKGP